MVWPKGRALTAQHRLRVSEGLRGRPKRPWQERFWSKVDKGDPLSCWNWIASRDSTGYGQFWTGERLVVAHRVAYEEQVGPIPEGMTLDHLCRNRACINPSHLEPVTLGENVLRGVGPPAQNARKTHCVRGHPLSGSNLYVTPSGGRGCRECDVRVSKDDRRRVVGLSGTPSA